MTEQERHVITSNDYVDYIIDYWGNPQVLEAFSDQIVQIMNSGFAILYVPVEQRTGRLIGNLGSVTTPNLFGLTSEISLESSGIFDLRNIPALNLTGKGVLVGIVDTGINYTLPVFRNTDGTTKVAAIWDQTIESEAFPPKAMFGTVYTREQINEALASENPFAIVPSMDNNGHGTMLAAIAAGRTVEEDNFYGVAPDAELVVVKLMEARQSIKNFFMVPENVLCYQENMIMWGVQYLIDTARELKRPMAICIALGSSMNAHDGNTPLAELLAIVADYPQIGVVCSVGNEGNRRRHFYGVVDPMIGNVTVELNVGEGETGFSMELWGNSPGIFSIDILSPSGEYIPRIAPGLRVTRQITFIFDQTVIYVEYHALENRNGDQLILLRFQNVSSGIWRFNVYGQGSLSSSFHIWLPMGDMISNNTYFLQPDIYTTVTSPGTSTVPITVTAYNPVNGTLYVNASRGYSRSGAIKPELAAPGVNYVAPNQFGEYMTFTGTGVAAAHTTGIVAISLERAVIQGFDPMISTLELKSYYIRGARRSANLTYPNRDWGYGILDIFNTFDVLRVGV